MRDDNAFKAGGSNLPSPDVAITDPRSTLEGFLDGVNSAYTLIMGAETALQATPPTMTRTEARNIEITAGNYLRRATAALDLRQVPRALREDIGIERIGTTKAILAPRPPERNP